MSSSPNAIQILFTDTSPKGKQGVEAPAACLINCHFTEEERGSSVFTTAALCLCDYGDYVNNRPRPDQQQTSHKYTKVKAWMWLFFLCAANRTYNAIDSVALPIVIGQYCDVYRRLSLMVASVKKTRKSILITFYVTFCIENHLDQFASKLNRSKQLIVVLKSRYIASRR